MGTYFLSVLAKVCSVDVLKMAYFGLVNPHLADGIRLWGAVHNTNLKKYLDRKKTKNSQNHFYIETQKVMQRCLHGAWIANFTRYLCSRGRPILPIVCWSKAEASITK